MDDEDPLPAAVVDSPAILRGHAGYIKDLAFSPDGSTLASGDNDGVVRLWDMRTGQGVGSLTDARNNAARSLAFSPDAATLAIAGIRPTLWHLDRATGTTLPEVDWAWSVAYGPDNTMLATGNSNTGVQLWNLQARKVVRTLRHTGTIHTLAFSPDNRTLASASYDRTVRLWDTRTGRHTATLTGHISGVMTVAFHPSGTMLASGGAATSIDYPEDNTVRLWNARTAQPIATLRGHTGSVSCVAFHPDGRTLASGSFDTTIRLWPINL